VIEHPGEEREDVRTCHRLAAGFLAPGPGAVDNLAGGFVPGVAVSPDRRRIAPGSEDGTIRLWPMPDLGRPPLRTLPQNLLLARLR
jgi:WD40 repeat protein